MKWMLRIVVLLVVCAPFALAAPPSAAQTTPSVTITPHTGVAGGDVVTLAGTGFEPNTSVFFCEANIAGPLDQSSCGNGGQVPPTVQADGNGAFSVPVTVFRFITPSTGLMDCAQPGATCGIGAANFTQSGQIVGAFAAMTFTTQPPATFAIEGSVTGPASNSLANAAVWAYSPSDSFVGSFQTVTDANGHYRLNISTSVNAVRFGPPAGTDLIAQWYDNQTHRNTSTHIFPFEFNDPVITLANQQLVAGGAIAGAVIGGSATGVSGVTVWAYGPGDTWVGSFGTTTAADGSYRISGVRPADYKVRFMPPGASGLAIEWYDNATLRADATSVTVIAGATTTGIDAQLSPSS